MVSINFYGSEKYDIIIYLARLINRFNKKVLVVDYSDSGALSKGINYQMNIDAFDEAIDYYGIYFLDLTNLDEDKAYSVIDKNISDLEIDYLFIDAGYDIKSNLLFGLSFAVYVTDDQLQNIFDLCICYNHTFEKFGSNTFLIQKDVMNLRNSKLQEMDKVASLIQKNNHYILFHDDIDYVLKLKTQMEPKIYPKRLSKGYILMLEELIKKLCPDENLKKLKDLKR